MSGIFHMGSWGTPDFGITEKIGDIFGLARTSQGGSQLKGTYDTGSSAIFKDQDTGARGTISQLYPKATSGAILGDTTAGGASSGGGGGGVPSSPSPTPSNPSGGGNPPSIDLYAEVGRAFDDVLGGLGGQQSEMAGHLKSAADTQKVGINEQLGYGIENLDKNRENVRSIQGSTLADLAQSLRDQARGVNTYLGARGVGGGSATEAASFALQKLFGKERAGVQRQGMAQMGEIDLAETNLKSKASEMLNNVDTWYNSNMADVASKFNDLRNNIGMMKADMRARAVESLWSEYNRIQTQRESYAQAIQQEARNRLSQLNNLKLELQNSAQFDPREMVYNEYGFDPRASYTPADYDPTEILNPLAMAKRRQNEE